MIDLKILFIIFHLSFVMAEKIDLNKAEFSDLESMNLSKTQINDVFDYRNRLGYISNIYDLLKVSLLFDQITFFSNFKLISSAHT